VGRVEGPRDEHGADGPEQQAEQQGALATERGEQA